MRNAISNALAIIVVVAAAPFPIPLAGIVLLMLVSALVGHLV